MQRKLVAVALWTVALGLWAVALVGAIMASDRLELTRFLFVATKPVVPAIAATLSISLVCWALTRPLVKNAIFYAAGYRHGRQDERETPTPEDDDVAGGGGLP
jgi:ABC-type nickel/cobalt efflux system permease component RcnA